MGNILKVDDYDILMDVNQAYKKRQDKILNVQKAILKRKNIDLDTADRLRAFLLDNPDVETGATSVIAENDFSWERLIGVSNDLLSIEALEHGLKVAKCVGLLETGPFSSTGFLIGENLIMTNWHNVQDKEDAENTRFILDFEDNDFGERKTKQTFPLKPERFYFSDRDNDVAIIAVHPKSREGKELAKYGSLRLSDDSGRIKTGQAVNIIQHPSGEKKKISMHNSNLVDLDDDVADDQFCYYSADTLKGSSGSPVFNKNWDVIALHRKGVPKTTASGDIVLMNGNSINRSDIRKHDVDIKWVSNQGVRITNIISVFKNAGELTVNEKSIRENLFKSWGLIS